MYKMKTRSKRVPESSCAKCHVLMKKTRGARKVVESESEAETFAKKMKTTILVNDVVCSKCVSKYKLLKPDVIKKKKEAKTLEFDLSWINDDSSLSDNTDNDPDFVMSTSSSDSDHGPAPSKIIKSDGSDASTIMKSNSPSDNTLEPSKKVETDLIGNPSKSTNHLIANHSCLIGSSEITDSGSSKNDETNIPSNSANLIANQPPTEISEAQHTAKNDDSGIKYNLKRTLDQNNVKSKHKSKKSKLDSLAETFENSSVVPVSSVIQQAIANFNTEMASLLADVSTSMATPDEATKLKTVPDSTTEITVDQPNSIFQSFISHETDESNMQV